LCSARGCGGRRCSSSLRPSHAVLWPWRPGGAHCRGREIGRLDERIEELDREIIRRAKADEAARRLMTISGIGAVTAAALLALAPAAATFRRGRDFAAWLGLTPLQHSSGGKERVGRTSKMGERTLRRLLIIGASAVARWAARNGISPGSWLGRMLSRKPPMLVRVALANKMARTVWALLARGGIYQAPTTAAYAAAVVGLSAA
jgi:transposase